MIRSTTGEKITLPVLIPREAMLMARPRFLRNQAVRRMEMGSTLFPVKNTPFTAARIRMPHTFGMKLRPMVQRAVMTVHNNRTLRALCCL